MNEVLDGDRLLAGRISRRADIVDVRLLRSTFELQKFPDGERRLSWDLGVRPDVELQDDAVHFVVTCDYVLRVLELSDSAAGPEADETVVTEVSFTFAALYELSPGEPGETTTNEELTAYGRVSGAFALYPYARAYVQDVTLRLGLPGLTLAVYRLPLSAQPVVASEHQ